MFEERETNLEMQSRICGWGGAELQVEWRLKANVSLLPSLELGMKHTLPVLQV